MKTKVSFLILFIVLLSCTTVDEPNYKVIADDSEILIEQNSDHSKYQITMNHSLIKSLFQTEVGLRSVLKKQGTVDDENVYLVRTDELYLLYINLKLKNEGNRTERISLVAVSKEGLDDHFMYFSNSSGEINSNGEIENFRNRAEDISYLNFSNNKQLRKLEISTTHRNYNQQGYSVARVNSMEDYGDTCVETYYMEMESDCNKRLVCNITCKIAAPVCALDWVMVASIRCFWDYVYGEEYFS